MSLDSLFSNLITQKISQNNDVNILTSSFLSLSSQIKNLADQTPKAFIFLKGPTALSSNVAANVEILAGPKIPPGHKATIKDFNLIYSTIAGTVRLVIMDANKTIIQPLLTGINSTTNGLGETVLEENQRLAVVGETAGAGLFTVYCSGIVQKNVILEVN